MRRSSLDLDEKELGSMCGNARRGGKLMLFESIYNVIVTELL